MEIIFAVVYVLMLIFVACKLVVLLVDLIYPDILGRLIEYKITQAGKEALEEARKEEEE
jgi:hypothetical protein